MKKPKLNWFFKILNLLFIIYVVLFIIRNTGYYDRSVHNKTVITSEKIESFEQDILNNKVVDIIDYFPEREDYSNVLTKSANYINDKLGNLLSKRSKNVWELIKTLLIG